LRKIFFKISEKKFGGIKKNI